MPPMFYRCWVVYPMYRSFSNTLWRICAHQIGTELCEMKGSTYGALAALKCGGGRYRAGWRLDAALSCGVMKVWVVKPAIDHESAMMRCFSRMQFWDNMAIGYFSSNQMLVNLYGDKDLDRGYAEEVISVGMKKFQRYQTYDLHISE